MRDEQGKYGFIDEAGTLVIPCTWQRVYSFSEDLAVVQAADGKWGYVNKDGEVVIPCRWASARSFTRGEAAVEDASGTFFHIDKQGNLKPLSFFRSLIQRFWDKT